MIEGGVCDRMYHMQQRQMNNLYRRYRCVFVHILYGQDKHSGTAHSMALQAETGPGLNF